MIGNKVRTHSIIKIRAQLYVALSILRVKMQKIVDKIIKIVGSKYFFWGVIAFFVLQAMWIALSFHYSMIYDESFHFGVIKIFGHQFSPFILNQPEAYDRYGNLAHGNATCFHYLMSFLYRLISIISDNSTLQIIFLRILNIFMVTGGFLLFSRLFKKIGIKQIFTNITLLVFTFLPVVPFISATINYDNMLFVVTVLYLIICVNILQAKKLIWSDYAWLVIVGCFASLVKFTFLPVFAVSVVYLTIFIIKKYGKHFLSEFMQSLRPASKRIQIGIFILFIVVIGMFSAIYLQNIIRYGSIIPACNKTMSEKRCLSNGVALRAFKATEKKDRLPLQSLSWYTNKWFDNMLWSTVTTGTNTFQHTTKFGYIPILKSVVFFSVFVATGFLVYAWKSLRKNSSWYFLITISTTLVVTLFLNNYLVYLKYHDVFATQARYLLTIVPIIIVMSIVAIDFVLKRKKYLKLVMLLIVLLLFTQGGGVITHILKSDCSWYWDNKTVCQVNDNARNMLAPFIKEYWYDR